VADFPNITLIAQEQPAIQQHPQEAWTMLANFQRAGIQEAWEEKLSAAGHSFLSKKMRALLIWPKQQCFCECGWPGLVLWGLTNCPKAPCYCLYGMESHCKGE